MYGCDIISLEFGWSVQGIEMKDCTAEIGTQPLYYCKNLRLVHCEMLDTALCFERSDVEATIATPVVSIKNPLSDHIPRSDPSCPGISPLPASLRISPPREKKPAWSKKNINFDFFIVK